MKLSLLFTSLIALSAAVPAPEAAPEAEAVAIADGRYRHGGHSYNDKCGNPRDTTYGHVTVQYGYSDGRLTQHDVPVYCGKGNGIPVRKSTFSPSFSLPSAQSKTLTVAKDSQNIAWARMVGGRVPRGTACQVRYYPYGRGQTRTSRISGRATRLGGRGTVNMHSVYCNI